MCNISDLNFQIGTMEKICGKKHVFLKILVRDKFNNHQMEKRSIYIR